MMSLPVWLIGGGLCTRGSLSMGVSVTLDRDPLYAKEQAVRILLEYILVFKVETNVQKMLKLASDSDNW